MTWQVTVIGEVTREGAHHACFPGDRRVAPMAARLLHGCPMHDKTPYWVPASYWVPACYWVPA
ncbi:MAG: hypothetical protein ACRELB_15825 [Polyangiaceae bacterium]